MSEYKKPYLTLFNGLSDIIEETDRYIISSEDITAYEKLENLVMQLKELQQKSEQLFLESDEKN